MPKKRREQLLVPKDKRLRIVTHKRFQQMMKDRQLNPVLFRSLIKIYNQACSGNFSQASQLLGVTRTTYIRWQEDIPPVNQHYWPQLIAEAIDTMLKEWRKKSPAKIRARAQELTAEFRQLMRDQEFHSGEVDISYAANAKQYLLSLFRDETVVGTRWLKREGRYNMRTLREAAVDLQLTRTTTGFGENKETFYSLPEDDDADD